MHCGVLSDAENAGVENSVLENAGIRIWQALYKPTLKTAKLNVINYKHETHVLAYTCKAGSWQI